MKNNAELLYQSEHLDCFLYDNYAIPMITHLNERKGAILKFNETHNRIIFLLKGRINFLYENQQTFIEKGRFFLLPRGGQYMVNVDDDASIVIVNLHNNLNFCEHYPIVLLYRLKKELVINHSVLYPLRIGKVIQMYLEGIIKTYSDGLRCTYFLEIKQRELLYYLRAYYSKKDLTLFFAPILNDDTEFAELIYRYHLSAKGIGDLANITNYSVSGFKKRFVKMFGVSPYQWMEREKAKMIHYDINCTNKSFKEISSKYHFASQSHFNSFCKKMFQLPPGALRERTICTMRID
ncbi:MAG: helix-turn-helix transcriptional regulator [Bacteroidales bacterium]|nr:helix-turn-helix transcriptional regulator [Bacteroidales bacterium]MCL2132810.1 helix-turn-helix transcriptional regulator [Bacteroidales bacterium]